MKRLAFMMLLAFAPAFAGAAPQAYEEVYTGSDTEAGFYQYCYTNGVLCEIRDGADKVLEPVGRFDRYSANAGTNRLIYSVVRIPQGYDLDETILVNMKDWRLSDDRTNATEYASYSGMSIHVPGDGGLPRHDLLMALLPCFSWLKYQLLYWKNDGTTTSRRDSDFYYEQIYTNRVTAMDGVWSRPGYEFVGWSRNANAAEAEFQPGETKTGADFAATTNGVNLYAIWEKLDLDLTLDPRGGTVSTTSLVVHVDEPYANLPTPARERYAFDGWFTSASGGTLVTNGTMVTKTDSHWLYAQWTLSELEITLDPKGGTLADTNIVATIGDGYYLPEPLREGRTFLGWFDSPSGGTAVANGQTVAEGDATTLYAHWSTLSFTVSVGVDLPRGGSVSPEVGDHVFEDGEPLNLSANAKDGYSFVGWSDGSTAASRTIVVQSNATYWASFKADDLGVDVLASPDPVTTATYGTIYFLPNGGTGQMKPEKKVSGDWDFLPPCTFTRTGRTFLGWATDPDATTPVYSDEDEIDQWPSDYLVLYAVWSEPESDLPSGTNALTTAWTVATVTGPGTLTFAWRSDRVYSAVRGDFDTVARFYATNGMDTVKSMLWTGGDWTTVNVDLTDIPEGVKISCIWFVSEDTLDASLADVTWTPSGEEETKVAYYHVREGLAYDGTCQTGIVAIAGCLLSRDFAATNAGSYKAAVRLSDGYKWSDDTASPSKASWSIAKGVYDLGGVSLAGQRFIYDGTPKSLAVSGMLPPGVEVSYTGNGNTEVGRHEVTASFAVDEANYEPITDMLTATLFIEPPGVASVATFAPSEDGGSWTLALSASGAGVFTLATSTNLVDWTDIRSYTLEGEGATVEIPVEADGPVRFWKLVQ